MAKLSSEDKFFDVSDYGRRPAMFMAKALKNTTVTPVQVTLVFGVCGALAALAIWHKYYITAAVLLILKSIIDALDGELSRAKNTPSYTGRYLDSIFDFILNALFIYVIFKETNGNMWLALTAFFCIQLQGTLYNYYYVILRNVSTNADVTSKVFENIKPIAMPGESQQTVNILYYIFSFFYSGFDKIIYLLDKKAALKKTFPSWFMTLVSFYGLGFQLLIMAIMLVLNFDSYIIAFFIGYTFLLIIIMGLRKLFVLN